jgi:hypothetical protein
MRTPSIATLSVTALLLTAGTACAAPVELICKENRHDRNPLHVIVDEEAGTITLDGDRHPAEFSDTQIVWEDTRHAGEMWDMYTEVRTRGTLHRATGILRAHADPFASRPHRVSRSGGTYTVTCVKAEKP